MKKYFNDGLIQLALLLSLIYRPDVDNYLNSYYSNYPEIHEIILGSSSAYTQTHFHSQNWHDGVGGGYSHLKNVDNYYASSVFQELNSLGYHRQFDGVDTNVGAWLVIAGQLQHANEPEQSNSQNDQNNNSGSGLGNTSTNVAEDNASSTSTEPDGPLGHAELPEESVTLTTGTIQNQTVSAVFPGTDLTKEDMDLIEVLWRQDIDLGVGREMFDSNLRKELEKERQLELQKQQEKEKELEKMKQEPLDQLSSNFIIDGETGEMIPAPPGENTVNQTLPLTNMPPQEEEPSEGLSIEAAMRMLEQQAENGTLNATTLSRFNNSQLQEDIGNMIDNAERYSNVTTQVPDYHRQFSLEQRWQDLACILELPPAATTPSATATATATSQSSVDLLNNNTMLNINTMNALNTLDTLNCSLDNNTGPLIHNATLMPSPQIQANFTPFSSIMEYPPATHFEPLTTPDTVTPLLENASMPSMGSPTVFGLDPGNFSLQNMTSGSLLNQTSNFSQSSGLLQGLLDQDNMMNELDFPDVDITQGVESMHVMDDASSDSAVSSMGSSASPEEQLDYVKDDFNDSHSNISTESGSPYDGLEGATGGSYDLESSPKYTKYEKYDSGYNYAESGYGQSDMHTNLSNSGNDSNYGYTPAEMRHVNHNHTYPLQPGQQSRESRKAAREAEKARSQEGRDEKRAKELKIPIPMATIVNAPVDEFSELIQKYTLNEQQLQLMRDIRRRGKNKVAAQHCRKRKLEVISTLEEEVEEMRAEKERLRKERLMIDKDAQQMKEKFGHLYQEVFQSLRDDNGQPYNPNEYSLQHTADGNVFLVPLNTTASEEPKQRSNRRRKAKDR